MTGNYVPYLEIVDHLSISRGNMVWLTGDLVQLALQSRRNKESFDPVSFINSFTRKIGDKGTLLIPSFNFNLHTSTKYNILKTRPITGALSEAAWKHPDFKRTWHPLHSFMVWGNHQDELVHLRNTSSFGPDSPFGFLLRNQAKMVIIGTNVTQAFTFVHFIEEQEKVRYRKMKKYNVRYIDASGRTNEMKFYLFAKNRGWTMSLEQLEKKFEESDVLIYKTINGISCSVIDLEQSAGIITDDISNNKARSIARFDYEIFAREIVKEILTLFRIRTLNQRIMYDQHSDR